MNEVVTPENVTVANMATSLLSPLVQVLVSVLLAVLTVVAKKAMTYFNSQVHINDVGLVANAAARIAGEITLQVEQQMNKTPDNFDVDAFIKTAVLAGATTLMKDRLPEVTAKIGVTPETVAGMIVGELGKVLNVRMPTAAPAVDATGAV